MAETPPLFPTREWMCQGCGTLNGRGMTAIPANCMRCGLPHTARAYPAFDAKAGGMVHGPFAGGLAETPSPAPGAGPELFIPCDNTPETPV